jgi:uncharacterized repeat protein (TIGR03803 family)
MLPRPAVGFALVRRASGILFALTAFFMLAGLSQPAQSQTYQVIHNFTGGDGDSPYGGPVLDQLGDLYGTTYAGGRYGAGSVYRLVPRGSSWKFSRLYSFKAGADGTGPGFGTLAIRPNCALFGTTEGGGNFGIAFEVQPTANTCSNYTAPWQESVIHSFGTGQDGAQPIGGLVLDSAGNFYGTTSLGGDYGNGTVFKGTRSGQSWVESVLYSFTGGSDGANPPAGVTLDAHGNLYGTSSFGGANGVGAVYELSPNGTGWTETVLYNFQGLNDGQNPVGGVILDQAGNIYGGTFDGGVNGGGTVYELSPSAGGWTFTTLYSFTGGYGGPYNKLTFDASGNLYGATEGEGAHGSGSVFKLTRANGTWTLTDLYDFTGGTDGGVPYGSLAVDAKGDIFGTTSLGGSKNQGVVFEITP